MDPHYLKLDPGPLKNESWIRIRIKVKILELLRLNNGAMKGRGRSQRRRGGSNRALDGVVIDQS
jgi:hypothetical protein